MVLNEIIRQIEEVYPVHYALEWDNVGLLLGRSGKEVERIYIALDATDEVIKNAQDCQADLLLTHHPMIFSPLKKITSEDFTGRRVLELLQHDISYYAMHTNYDVLRMGKLAADMLRLENCETLQITADDRTEGIGRIGCFSSGMELLKCAEYIKEVFGLPNVKVFGDPEQSVCRVAVVPGSGKSCISDALNKGADLLITGDIGHHEGIDAAAQGMAVIDAGHFGLEHIFIRDMEQFLKKIIPDIQIGTEDINFPYCII